MSTSTQMATCEECGEYLPLKMTIQLRSMDWKILCGDCMRKREVPPSFILVRSNWAPYGELPVIRQQEVKEISRVVRRHGMRRVVPCER